MAMRGDLGELIFKDDLTKLYNRRYLANLFKSKAFTEGSISVSFLMLDIDNFKALNDTFGHQKGDELLIKLGELYRRLTDGKNRIVIRYGGDEFLFVLIGSNKEESFEFGKKLIDTFKEQFLNDSKYTDINLGISLGLATYPEDAKNSSSLISLADKAMYSAKKLGHNNIIAFGDVLQGQAHKLLCLQRLQDDSIIARENELKMLLETISSFKSPENRKWFIIIEGTDGAGKTTLLTAAKNRIKDSYIIYRKCQPFDVQIAYGLIRELLLQLLSDDQFKSVVNKELNEKQKNALGKIVPEIIKPSPKYILSKFELFDVLLTVLRKCFMQKQVIFMIDNGHFVDEPSYSVLREFVQIVENKPVVIITSNYNEGATIPHFITFKTSIVEYTEKIITEPLSEDAVTAFTTALLGGYEIDEEIMDLVFQMSVGIPLVIITLLKELLASDFIRFENSKWITSDKFEDKGLKLLKDRVYNFVGNIDETSRVVLNSASVIGEKVEFELLKGTLNRQDERITEGQIISAVDELIKENLLKTEEPFVIDNVEFTSKIIQKTVYESISDDQKKTIHNTVAEVQEERFKDNPEKVLEQLYYHYAKAGNTPKADAYSEQIKARFIESFDEGELVKYVQWKIGTAKAKIQEFNHNLDDDSLNQVLEFTRNLLSCIKFLRIYPGESSIVLETLFKTYKFLQFILESSKGFTIALEGEKLRINKFLYDPDKFDNRHMELFDFLKKKKIQSLTFLTTVGQKEFEGFTNAMLNDIEATFIEENYWENIIEKAKINSVGVVTYSYVSKEKTFDKSGDLIIELVKSFNGLLVISKVYPPTSNTVQDRTKAFIDAFKSVAGNSRECSISSSDGDILFNGKLISRGKLAGSTKDVEGLFERFGLNSIVFKSELNYADVESFLNLMEKTKRNSPEQIQKELENFKTDTITLERKEILRKIISAEEVIQLSPVERLKIFLSKSDE
ncbi:MAG: diguanylate cyclase [Planctomycetes bacterium]|nr:diguanylate cyclase [Planctomycetota bacterium]